MVNSSRNLNNFQKAEMGMALLEVTKRIAKAHIKAGTSVPKETRVGRSTEKVAKEIGLSRTTFERAKKVIIEGAKLPKLRKKGRSWERWERLSSQEEKGLSPDKTLHAGIPG